MLLTAARHATALLCHLPPVHCSRFCFELTPPSSTVQEPAKTLSYLTEISGGKKYCSSLTYLSSTTRPAHTLPIFTHPSKHENFRPTRSRYPQSSYTTATGIPEPSWQFPNKLKACVVGSGPAGFYTAEFLFKEFGDNVEIAIVEKLPVPFGLIRFGVAPDHPEVKAVTANFEKILQDKRVRYFGNVTVGKDVFVNELRDQFHLVIFATGCDKEKRLGIEGSKLNGVYSAHEFVSWYNGHPDYASWDCDLKSTKEVAVIGNGNVALDVARILVAPLSLLAPTDITSQSLEKLKSSAVHTVHLIGRRGPAQAAFTNKELRELINLEGCDVFVRASDVSLDPASQKSVNESRPLKRMLQLLQKSNVLDDAEFAKQCRLATSPLDCESSSDCPRADQKKRVFFHFLRSPTQYLSLSTTASNVTHCAIEVNELKERASGMISATGTDKQEFVSCGMVFESIGYEATPIEPTLPMDVTKGVIMNDLGKVGTQSGGLLAEEGQVNPLQGVYVTGWVKRGPSGIVGSNRWDAQETVMTIAGDMKDIAASLPSRNGFSELEELLRARGIDSINNAGWSSIDSQELQAGEAAGKVREKFQNVSEMLQAARSLVK